ncbi:MAG: ABC transporter ATP-binding protein [Ilumatobacter sp.]|uniref:ABC transporter ATP-binding protein n=1 Tax=Ilumatobacter sp. TaxID=1967498 RepID=UPI003C75B119
MAAVSLQDLTTSIGRQAVLEGIDMEIADGGFAAVIGPSGTGKSTLLRSIAGLVTPSRGKVRFDGVDVTSVKVAERDIGFVFQSPALLPSRNVRRNVQFPLEVRKQTAEAIRERVGAEARAMHIEHLLERNPTKLSRGEQQLVQIARTMVRMPRVLLLDEPFAPLDEHLRQRMRHEIRTLQAGYGVTTLMATNDPVDAMSLASLLIVLDGSPASVVQVGTPSEVHDEPASLDIASATGPMWRIPVDVSADGGGYWLSASGAVRLRSWSPALAARVGSVVTLGVRTGGLVRQERGEAEAQLVRIVPGAVGGLLCRWGGRLVTAVGGATAADIGTTIRLRLDRPQLFDAATGSRLA